MPADYRSTGEPRCGSPVRPDSPAWSPPCCPATSSQPRGTPKRCGSVQLDVTFFSTVDPNNLQRQSVPMSYLTVQASSVDGNAHQVSVYLDISGEWAHGDVTQQITWNQQAVGGQVALTCTPNSPSVLAEYGDQASWGTVVFAADAVSGLTWQIGQDTVVRANAANGALPNTVDGN